MGEFHSQIVLTIYKLIEQNVIRFTAQHKISSGSKKSVVQIVRENLSLGDLRPSDIATLSENQILEVITTLERDQAAKEKSRREKAISEVLEGPELEKYRVFKDLHYVGRISGCEDFIIVDKEKGAIEPNLTPLAMNL